jgi:hypothetical protein
VYDDGGLACNDIPSALVSLLTRRGDRGDLACVSLGPSDEYYLKTQGGDQWWGGMTTEAMKQVNKYKKSLKFLDFGRDGTFVARHV